MPGQTHIRLLVIHGYTVIQIHISQLYIRVLVNFTPPILMLKRAQIHGQSLVVHFFFAAYICL
jgi:hypothetical protein